MAEIDFSRANSEELCKANEELYKNLQQLDQRSTAERGPSAQPRARPKPFSQAIMDALVPTNYIMPKIVFTRLEDPENHLTMFNAQMIISGEQTLSIAKCSWVRSRVQPCNGLVAFLMTTSPPSTSFPSCSENNSLSTRPNR